jgi:serine/threonine protein kinase
MDRLATVQERMIAPKVSTEPTIFGRYQLLEPIAKGGMAEVFKAKLNAAAGTEKVLCIKRILPTHSSNQDFIKLFVQEAKIALSLTHGNITQVFDFGEVDGVYYLAMEHIFGQDLNAVLRRVREVGGRIDLPAALYVAAEVCKGLQYAHTFTDGDGRTRAVVHRDVTPHNILIAYTGQVKLADFGIALAATKVSTMEREVVRGKACYLSPEQAAGEPGEPRSDIFSLGAVLYEALTGTRPFDADGEREILERLRTHDPEPPSQHNDEIDSELDAVVLKALARDPGARYARAGDLQVALNQLLVRQWPDYTAETLAETLKELFAWEIATPEGQSSDQTRNRLLFQLSRAGIEVEDTSATTDELLALGTIAISSAPSPETSTGKGRRLLLAALGVVAVVVVVVVGIVLYGDSSGGNQHRVDAGGPPPMPSIEERTTHITPESIKKEHLRESSPPIPAAVKKPVKTRTKPAAVRVAWFNFNSWPWSVVYVNGRRLRGNTPLLRVRVAAGRHRIRFENPELGLSKEVTVTVDAGNTKTVAVSLQQ